MSNCDDYWCEHYGQAYGGCDRCDRKSNSKDEPNLRVVLKRRADKLMEIDKAKYNELEQSR